MDIHAPLEPIHNWKDIAIHLGIVTIGLFIALMLEGLVEYVHHRHIVAEARANIRQEIEDNHKAAQDNVKDLDRNIRAMESNIRTIHLLEQKAAGHLSLVNSMQYSAMGDAAWSTARDTGALAYMPYAEVQRYADIYTEQSDVNQQANRAAHNEFQLLAPTVMGTDFKDLPPGEFDAMLHGSASSLLDLCVLRQVIEQLDQQYVNDLGGANNSVKIDSCSNLMQ
ncbi:MAG TPA: hypothetical protein VHY48_01615 [Acidobacteriaceae bacterium]|jgi:hypothetical protein|nr:hypothetical protein [Acidobacteriaceae bacterium]